MINIILEMQMLIDYYYFKDTDDFLCFNASEINFCCQSQNLIVPILYCTVNHYSNFGITLILYILLITPKPYSLQPCPLLCCPLWAAVINHKGLLVDLGDHKTQTSTLASVSLH